MSDVRRGPATVYRHHPRHHRSAKQAEQALLRADALKDEFLANTSHELRTPLNGIIGIGQSMLDGATGPLSDQQRQNLGMLVASGRRLANLVNDLLDFSKLRHEKIELHCRPTDLHALADLVLTVSRTLVGKRPLRLFNRIDPQVPLVEVDEDRMQQILFNLVGNAIKFTPAGAVEVSAHARDEWLDVTVSDTGVGIGEDGSRQSSIRFPKATARLPANRAVPVLGLPSPAARRTPWRHNWVESEVGVGSRFTFTLPLSQTTSAMMTLDAGLTKPSARFSRTSTLTRRPPVPARSHRPVPATGFSWWTTSP